MKQDIREPDEFFQIGEKDGRLPIYLRYQLFKALDEFAARERHREQVGLLVGRVGKRSDGRGFLLVEDAIESPVGDEEKGRFDEGLWKRARRIAAARHPNRQVVGWFHSHPSGGLEVTEEEQAVHKRFFPEDTQVLYVLDPKADDRNFFLKDGKGLAPLQGFAIFGKPASGEVKPMDGPTSTAAQSSFNTVGPMADQQSRVIERSLEKILRRLQRPPLAKKDLAIIALLLFNALLIWFRPNPPVAVDTASLERGQAEISERLVTVHERIERLEKHLAELQLLDEQLRLVAELEDLDGDLDPDLDPPERDPISTTPAAVAERTASLKGGAGRVELYKVEPGDTLSVIAGKVYPEVPEDLTSALARFNRLAAPDFAIFPGDTLKVPPVESLR